MFRQGGWAVHWQPQVSGWEEGGKFKHARIFLHLTVGVLNVLHRTQDVFNESNLLDKVIGLLVITDRTPRSCLLCPITWNILYFCVESRNSCCMKHILSMNKCYQTVTPKCTSGSVVQGYDSCFGCRRSRVQIPAEPAIF